VWGTHSLLLTTAVNLSPSVLLPGSALSSAHVCALASATRRYCAQMRLRDILNLNKLWPNFLSSAFVFDSLYDLVVRVPGYTTEMYFASCEV
jgi:hypothetical protein